ncbi:MAG: hypothetical protein M1830_004924 [Pleopsidium flavum]|nr:MAG: hypothetical protein M1830_004924 [Pleopsidium flavum]
MIGNVNATTIDQYLAKYNINLAEVVQVVQTTDLADFIAGIDPSDLPHMQDLPTGYITWVDAGSNQYAFLLPEYFDPEILLFSESHKFPYTLGELLTIGGAPKMAPMFTGPVQVITGNEDAIYCGGDCMMTGDPALASIPAAVKMAFPAASAFEAYIQPNTGHAINLHYNSTAAYNVMLQFLNNHGLAPS